MCSTKPQISRVTYSNLKRRFYFPPFHLNQYRSSFISTNPCLLRSSKIKRTSFIFNIHRVAREHVILLTIQRSGKSIRKLKSVSISVRWHDGEKATSFNPLSDKFDTKIDSSTPYMYVSTHSVVYKENLYRLMDLDKKEMTRIPGLHEFRKRS